MEQNKVLIKQLFKDVIENMQPDESVIAKYFAKDYIQLVDGKTLNYDDFVNHMFAQKKAIKSVKINFEHMVAENNKVVTIHHIDAVKNNGNAVKGKVIALFELRDNQIIKCDELTHIYHGDEEDKELGSVTD